MSPGCAATVIPSGNSFLLDHGSYTTFDVPGSLYTGAYGINDLGQIVGRYDDSCTRLDPSGDDYFSLAY
jgi:hypothetical protein